LCATDIVLRELKREPSSAHVVAGGVRVIELSGNQVAEVYGLASTLRTVSAQDASALVAARDLPGVLLTGDGHLRRIARDYQIEVHGSLWMIEHLADKHGLDPVLGLTALDAMVSGGSRLPESEVNALRRRLKGG
jgi:predicted nucleic acid-binding protein